MEGALPSGEDGGEVRRAENVSIPHSPTSVVDVNDDDEGEDMDLELPDPALCPGAGEGEGGGKRRRPEQARGSSPDGERAESPSKRVHDDASGIVTCRELRLMLGQHMMEMKAAWGNFEGRVAAVEKLARGHDKELKAVHTRHKGLEARVQGIQAKGDATSRRTEELEGKVEQLASQVQELASRPSGVVVGKEQLHDGVGDPWADYLNKKNAEDGVKGHGASSRDEGRNLSEEDQKTLIIGGWLPDTRRAKIEEEVEIVLGHEAIQPLLDTDKLVIFGPRRSFGMLRFQLRQGEQLPALKKRMWEVVLKIRGEKFILESTKGEHGLGGKTVWASFVKTPEARRRSALCSLTRRVTIQLAGLGGDKKNEAAMAPEGYDVDWGTGTIWSGELKLASATHRRDGNRGDDFFQLPQGWVDIRAITTLTNVDWAEAVAAFQREI